MEKESEMRSSTAELSVLAKFKPVDHAASSIPTNHFLSICNLILQFLGNLHSLSPCLFREQMFLLLK